MLINSWIINQWFPKAELFAILNKNDIVLDYFLKIKRKGWFWIFNMLLFMRVDNSLLSEFGMERMFNIFTFIIWVICPFYFDKEFLSMRSDLCACPSLDEIFYFFPVFSVELKTVKELFMLFLGPSACSPTLINI